MPPLMARRGCPWLNCGLFSADILLNTGGSVPRRIEALCIAQIDITFGEDEKGRVVR